MEQLIRLEAGLFVKRKETWNRLAAGTSLDALLNLPLQEIRRVLDRDAEAVDAPAEAQALAPIESQEVWAAGVTYKRSLTARAEEAVSADPYERVYTAARPELFFKATASRVRGPGDVINIRSDSTWDVPEPELAVVCNSRMEVVGYTIGNDMSSRSIEGENTLYLPQAKVFDGCCALGPAIALAWDYSPDDRRIGLEIKRAGLVIFAGETSTSAMRRKVPELLEYLGRDQSFAHGCVLLTGTGVVPPQDVTLQDGDEVAIAIDGIGVLTNTVRRHPV
jgi:2-dehydro-3-deoxy-D-arabinonate dehydratase